MRPRHHAAVAFVTAGTMLVIVSQTTDWLEYEDPLTLLVLAAAAAVGVWLAARLGMLEE